MDTICGVRVQQKTVRFILKTMDPDGERLRSIHKQRRRGPNFWYIWVVITLFYHMDFSFIVLKIGYPGRYCVAQTFYTKKSQVCGKTV